MEQSGEDIIWSRAIYVKAEEIKQAFNLSTISVQQGISPNQPSPFSDKAKMAVRMAALFLAALFVVQFTFVSTALNQTIFERQVHTTPTSKGQDVIAEAIDIPKNSGNIEVTASSPVSNNWVELDVSLVNDTTQESYDLTQTMEYYFGSDSDGYWSEGSQNSTNIISAVAGGKYHLLVSPDAGVYQNWQPVDFSIKIKRDVPIWGNFILALLIISAYPVYILWRSKNFETQRWANSDCSPTSYTNHQK